MKTLNFKRITCVGVLTLSSLFLGCSKKESIALPNQGDPTQQSQKAVYPHAVNWNLGALHGTTYLDNPSSCKSCHGQDLLGGVAKVSCATCHINFPHSAEFKSTKLHGVRFFRDRLNCTSCHGRDYAGGDTQISCTKCHNYPHEKDWGLPGKHGVAFYELGHRPGQPADPMKRDYSACMNCHDKQKNPTSPALSCSGCHADMPHGSKFPGPEGVAKPIRHGQYVEANPTKHASCMSCHTNPASHAPQVSSTCMDCHEDDNKFPVPEITPTPEPTPAPTATPKP
jgi:hypothetical protein